MNTQLTFKKFLVLPLFALLLVFNACSSGGTSSSNTPENGSIGSIPKFLLQTANNGTLRADLEVYGPDGTLVYTEALQINTESTEVFSSQFRLDRGFTYSFLITFYYTKQGIPEVPIAFVAKIGAAEEDFLSIFWEATEVLIAVSQLNPAISASFSTTNFPDLDSDDDTFNNFAELKEGSDPLDASSTPSAPTIESTEIINTVDVVEFKVIFNDASGVSQIEAVGDFICGYIEWTVTPLDEAGLRQELHAKFNLHTYADANLPNEIPFQIQVSDVLGISTTHDILVSTWQKNALGANDPLDAPGIAIIKPREGETVSDFIDLEAIACDEDTIFSLEVKDLTFNDLAGSEPDILLGPLNTIDLGDGEQNITFKALDQDNNLTEKTVKVLIANNNPIKIDIPQPGSLLKDGFTVSAHVDKNVMPDVTNLLIESITDSQGKEIFSLNQLKFDVNTLPEAFTGQIFDTSEVQNQLFTIKYVAVGASSTEEREVTYQIQNFPVIEFFGVVGRQGPNVCFSNDIIELEWEVDNHDGTTASTKIAGEEVPSNVTAQGSTVGFPANEKVACAPSIELRATRTGKDANNNDTEFTDQSTIELSVIDVQHTSPSKVKPDNFELTITEATGILDSNDTLRFDVHIINNDGTQSPFTKRITTIYGTGIVITNADLDNHLLPRTSYSVTIDLLNNDINNSQGLKTVSYGPQFDFITVDDGLVGWWRFDEEQGNIVNDYSGNDHHLGIYPGSTAPMSWAPAWLPNGLSFDGNSSEFLVTENTNIHGADNALTIEALVYVDPSYFQSGLPTLPPDAPYLITKDGEFSLGFVHDPNSSTSNPSYQYQLILGLHDTNGTSCGSTSFNDLNMLPPATTQQLASSNNSVTQGWHHIAVTFNGDEVNFYIDGIKDTQPNSVTTPPATLNTECNLSLAINALNYYNTQQQPTIKEDIFKGIIGETTIYNRVLDQNEMEFFYCKLHPNTGTECATFQF